MSESINLSANQVHAAIEYWLQSMGKLSPTEDTSIEWISYAADDGLHSAVLNIKPQPVIWVCRNGEPAHRAQAHAYEGDYDVSLCGKHNRSKFDWTEADGERCIQCQHYIKE